MANYRTKKTQQSLAPTNLKTFLHGIQRGFRSEWGYDLNLTSGPIFNHPEEGLLTVADNKVREQQSSGNHVVSHHVLSRYDLVKLYKSASLSRDSPKELQARVIFTVGILTAMRPSALATLKVWQFKRVMIKDQAVWMISGVIRRDCGALKTERGGWAAIGNKVPEISVYDKDYESRCINFFKDLDDYMSLRSITEVGTERFFVAVNVKIRHRREFLKRQHLAKNSFSSVVKYVCLAEGIEGSGKKNWVTTHGPRGTLASLLFENGHSD